MRSGNRMISRQTRNEEILSGQAVVAKLSSHHCKCALLSSREGTENDWRASRKRLCVRTSVKGMWDFLNFSDLVVRSCYLAPLKKAEEDAGHDHGSASFLLEAH
jgi:hypothetical protein